MGTRTTLFAVWASLAAFGCGGGGAQMRNPLGDPSGSESSRYAGDPSGPPRMEGLPEGDVSRSELSDAMKRAWLLAEEALAVSPPTRPEATSAASLQVWSDTVLSRWLEAKTARAMAARQELNAAAEQSERERIMAGALLGLVYEDVARVLVEVPVPSELKTEPEIAEMYHEVMLGQAEPFLANARAAYDACAGNARYNPRLRHWGRYCEHRREVLPGAQIEAVDGTVVTVEHD